MLELFKVGRRVTSNDANRSPYLFLADKFKLEHYRLITDGEFLIKLKSNLYPEYVTRFIKEHREVLLIANLCNGVPISMTIRSIKSKHFIDWGNTRGMLYGLGTLSEDFRYGDPIVLVEGNKDTDTMKSLVYKNTLGILTSSLSDGQIKVLQSLTNNVFLMLDNDEFGRKGTQKAIRRLKPNFKVTVIEHYEGLKDSGDLVDLLRDNRITDVNFITSYYSNMIELGR